MFFSIFLLTALFNLAWCSGEGGFSYNPASPLGPPTAWGTFPDFPTCGRGRSQSPIDIPRSTKRLSSKNMPELETTKGEWKMEKTSFNFAFVCESSHCGKMNHNGKTYDLVNLHFHSPSEHMIRGRRYPLEAHLVHRSSSGSLAVVGVLFRIDDSNKALDTIFKSFGEESSEHVSFTVDGLLNSGQSDDDDDDDDDYRRGFYNYEGSLTTPPCTEGVMWMVSKQVRNVSLRQLYTYIRQIGPDGRGRGFGNNRPTQPLNGRIVKRIL